MATFIARSIRLRPRDQPAVLLVAPPPFQHPGREDPFRLPLRLRPDLLEKLVQRLARPEGPVEDRRLALRLPQHDVFLDDDRPAPEGHDEQHDHDDLHRQGCTGKKGEHGEINLLRHRKGFGFHYACSC
jgi:hypothetical protein